MVGTARFELATPCTPSKCATRLRYVPTEWIPLSCNPADPADKASRDDIRAHLSHIAEMFAAGNLNIPMFIHDTTPPGAPVMEKLHDQIHYKFQQTEAGARVRIQTADKQALKAVHEFLRFQIAEHQTGDRTDITNDNSGT